jgi:membrane-associated protease RseP (regulator of RpoE activity)
VALAGPLVNALLVLSWHWWPMFGLANVIFAVVNLLPITNSDGLRVARCLQEMSQDRSNDAWEAARSQNEIPRTEKEGETVAIR